MSKKTKSNQKTSMSYGYMTPTDTPDIIAARQAAAAEEGQDPGIQYRAARQKQALSKTLSNPFGANVSPETLEAMRYARESDIDQQAGQAAREDYFRRKQARFQRLYGMAGLTAPRLVQTGGTSQGTVSQPIWDSLLMGGIGAAAQAF